MDDLLRVGKQNRYPTIAFLSDHYRSFLVCYEARRIVDIEGSPLVPLIVSGEESKSREEDS